RHRVTQAPEEIAPGDGLADRRLHVARFARADGVHGLQDQPAMKSSLTARRVHPWSIARGRKPEPGKNMFDFSTSSYTKTFSHGTSAWSRTRMASFSSIRLESG